jgi:hypothetical protein
MLRRRPRTQYPAREWLVGMHSFEVAIYGSYLICLF